MVVSGSADTVDQAQTEWQASTGLLEVSSIPKPNFFQPTPVRRSQSRKRTAGATGSSNSAKSKAVPPVPKAAKAKALRRGGLLGKLAERGGVHEVQPIVVSNSFGEMESEPDSEDTHGSVVSHLCQRNRS